MARVNVEQKALSDPRFRLLGTLLGYPTHIAAEAAIGQMVKVWNECQERGTYFLDPQIIEAIFSDRSAVEAVNRAELAEMTDSGVRIKGTEDRVEWLTEKRGSAKAGGRARASNLSPERRSEIASAAAKARWGDACQDACSMLANACAPAPAPALPEEEPECREPSSEVSRPAFLIPTRDGTPEPISPSEVEAWQEAHPSLDVPSEVRKATAWLQANPKKAKTHRGVRRFMIGWLGRAGDRPQFDPEPRAPRILRNVDPPEAWSNWTDEDRERILASRLP